MRHGLSHWEQLHRKLPESSILTLKNFIRAEVISFVDYKNFKTEAKVKEAGKMRIEGKEYIVQDGDVMHFRFNV